VASKRPAKVQRERGAAAGGPAVRNGTRRAQLRQPRLAEMVAASLRNDILEGRLVEGDTLPRQEDLLEEFKVSPPAVREALRILETEGLISVRRGNVGGATVHLPTAQGVGYMVSLVLQLRQVSLDDVGAALRELEPICATLCASRSDRRSAVVKPLKAVIDEQEAALDDPATFERGARKFHETLVANCGNETMILVVGALESVWNAHQQRVYEVRTNPSAAALRTALQEHHEVVDAIAEGDTLRVATLVRDHVAGLQSYTLKKEKDRTVIADLLRPNG
jgi:GntR family transcriptional repressor for pyruvate dehydrogenase complex